MKSMSMLIITLVASVSNLIFANNYEEKKSLMQIIAGQDEAIQSIGRNLN